MALAEQPYAKSVINNLTQSPSQADKLAITTSTAETSMSEVFDLLRGSVFEDVLNILVANNPDRPNPKLSPFISHRIAAEAASDTPLREISFSIETLDKYEAAEYVRPESLVIHRADGGVVTVTDVVKQLSARFIAHKDEILEAKEPLLHATIHNSNNKLRISNLPLPIGQDIPEDTQVYFNRFFSRKCLQNLQVYILG
ncbi:hypothetical protein P153DRAFT_429593 [Dothidotthia symphoricarpi CBS 119687]|uniref:Uncharacterized protein n=1 Tax=Dothidotthia symphoricarpi CBS 119687 TaxID=1392245 RepID=A0A6A6ANF0_9PLEO|nr:uncharacterized protein P153DRAFT_429593 [Dothidotthia symphoricarpi CBS 119687]KAF2132464.1 hypothetical protein P153DRAFT_429593 [Dothidotthia symphoricarpi CBS 119687]